NLGLSASDTDVLITVQDIEDEDTLIALPRLHVELVAVHAVVLDVGAAEEQLKANPGGLHHAELEGVGRAAVHRTDDGGALPRDQVPGLDLVRLGNAVLGDEADLLESRVKWFIKGRRKRGAERGNVDSTRHGDPYVTGVLGHRISLLRDRRN